MLGVKKSLLGLDIGSRFIKCVEFSIENGTPSLQNFGIMEIPQGVAVADALRDFLRKHHFTTNRTVTAISGRSVIVRYLTMGVLSDAELRNAIKYEASKYIPFEVEEVVIDYHKFASIKPESKEMKIVLVAAKKSSILEHLEMLEKIGLSPRIVDYDIFAIGNAFETTVLKKIPSNTVVSLLDIGATKSCINIISDGESAFTREIYIGGSTFTDLISQRLRVDPAQAEVIKKNPGTQEDTVKDIISVSMDDLANEIKLSVDYFENSTDREVKGLYLSGGSSMTVGLQDFLRDALNKETFLWNPCSEPIVTKNVNQTELNKVSNQLAVAVGLALRIKK